VASLPTCRFPSNRARITAWRCAATRARASRASSRACGDTSCIESLIDSSMRPVPSGLSMSQRFAGAQGAKAGNNSYAFDVCSTRPPSRTIRRCQLTRPHRCMAFRASRTVLGSMPLASAASVAWDGSQRPSTATCFKARLPCPLALGRDPAGRGVGFLSVLRPYRRPGWLPSECLRVQRGPATPAGVSRKWGDQATSGNSLTV
jgi:hypothetical protein